MGPPGGCHGGLAGTDVGRDARMKILKRERITAGELKLSSTNALWKTSQLTHSPPFPATEEEEEPFCLSEVL